MVQGYGGNIYDIQPNNETTRVLAADFGSYFLSRWNFLVLVWSKNSSLFLYAKYILPPFQSRIVTKGNY